MPCGTHLAGSCMAPGVNGQKKHRTMGVKNGTTSCALHAEVAWLCASMQVLLMNMRQEVLAAAHQASNTTVSEQEDACTDVLLSLNSNSTAHSSKHSSTSSSSSSNSSRRFLPDVYIGHNEDMTNDTLGRVFFVRKGADNVRQALELTTVCSVVHCTLMCCFWFAMHMNVLSGRK